MKVPKRKTMTDQIIWIKRMAGNRWRASLPKKKQQIMNEIFVIRLLEKVDVFIFNSKKKTIPIAFINGWHFFLTHIWSRKKKCEATKHFIHFKWLYFSKQTFHFNCGNESIFHLTHEINLIAPAVVTTIQLNTITF